MSDDEAPAGTGLFDQPVLVVSQKAKLLELNNEYAVFGENWRAWNFSVRDRDDVEIARITKTWEGLAKTMFTTADNYVVHIHRPLDAQLRPLVVAAALCVDTALKQDARGLG